MQVQAGGCVVLSSELGETEEGAGFSGFCLSSRHPLSDGGQGVKWRWLEAVQNGEVLILRLIVFPSIMTACGIRRGPGVPFSRHPEKR